MDNYGKLSKKYAESRREYPMNVLDYLWTFIELSNPRILDIGCGTGISSRQLAGKGAEVIGVDRDEFMIEQAEKENKNIKYVVAEAEHLPFPDDTFNIVTAFSSFHWTKHEEVLEEIKRVLKNNGMVFIANKEDGPLRTEYKKILKPFIEQVNNLNTKEYNPRKLLEDAGFHDISKQTFPNTDQYSYEDGLSYLQSITIWNKVPDDRKNEVLKMTENFVKNKLDNNLLKREYEISVIVGKIKK